MKPDELIRQAGYLPGPEFGKICQLAAKLAGEGADDKTILAQVAERFGSPPSIVTMRRKGVPVAVFGEDIDPGALTQIYTAAKLPISVAGAIMADGHLGYALPIGGVWETENAVSPSAVGYDIACRMTMSVLPLTPEELAERRDQLLADLIAETRFGAGAEFSGVDRRDHEVMTDSLWDELPHVGQFKDLAWRQLGSSGGGNHFADLMIGKVVQEVEWLPLPKGAQFTALVTHSGSRGTGHKLATRYVKLAERETAAIARGIPRGYEWLRMDAEAGKEYWRVMQLMGRYAQANHHLIHAHFTRRAGLSVVAQYENHHNFAWLTPEGHVLHRKGATPAEQGRPGIIPGSSGTASYLVEGLGNPDALFSSPHGAGRPFSRSEAKRRHDAGFVDEWMAEHDIATVGLAPDETLLAYKDIESVMEASRNLVAIVARMFPVAVLMGGASDDGD